MSKHHASNLDNQIWHELSNNNMKVMQGSPSDKSQVVLHGSVEKIHLIRKFGAKGDLHYWFMFSLGYGKLQNMDPGPWTPSVVNNNVIKEK